MAFIQSAQFDPGALTITLVLQLQEPQVSGSGKMVMVGRTLAFQPLEGAELEGLGPVCLSVQAGFEEKTITDPDVKAECARAAREFAANAGKVKTAKPKSAIPTTLVERASNAGSALAEKPAKSKPLSLGAAQAAANAKR